MQMMVLNQIHALFFICIILISQIQLSQSSSIGVQKGTAHKCVLAAAKIAATGDGTTSESCMGCDPALSDCYSGCQSLIKSLYYSCDSVCLPDGYYFDPQNSLSGCWSENKFDVKIKVERCGCSSSSRSFGNNMMGFSICISLFIFFFQFYV